VATGGTSASKLYRVLFYDLFETNQPACSKTGTDKSQEDTAVSHNIGPEESVLNKKRH
jgi:hypothetical protein